jgi:hypothetical protein
METKVRHSLMLYDTTISIPAKVAMGISAANLPTNKTINNKNNIPKNAKTTPNITVE